MAEENVQKLLDMLYEMIDEAKNAPLSNDKCVLNRDEALDLLDEIRAQMPVELKRAQELVRVRDEYVEADKLLRTEEAVQMALDEVKQTRVRFRAASNEQMQRRREELNKSLEKNDKEDK